MNEEEKLEWVSGTVGLNVGGRQLQMEMTVPSTPIHPKRMLPILQQMTNSFVDIAVEEDRAEGYTVSCKAGCGACCRQLVPISEIEARNLSDLVAAMPEPRQSEIRRRFDEAIKKFEEVDMLEPLRDPNRFTDKTIRDMGIAYFAVGVPCPFLEEESCSIHPDRPLACREYLVTTPPENCKRPTADSIRQIEIPAKVSNAVIRLSEQGNSRFIPYVPMILALEWVEEHEDTMPLQTGPEILKHVLENLSGKEIDKEKTSSPSIETTNDGYSNGYVN
jgi:Fe-S-cluster containining protein